MDGKAAGWFVWWLRLHEFAGARDPGLRRGDEKGRGDEESQGHEEGWDDEGRGVSRRDQARR